MGCVESGRQMQRKRALLGQSLFLCRLSCALLRECALPTCIITHFQYQVQGLPGKHITPHPLGPWQAQVEVTRSKIWTVARDRDPPSLSHISVIVNLTSSRPHRGGDGIPENRVLPGVQSAALMATQQSTKGPLHIAHTELLTL